MNTSRLPAWFPSGRSGLIWQACTALLVLGTVSMPAQGTAVLYIPLHAQHPGAAISWARDEGATLLGAGPFRGAWLLRAPASGAAARALASGAILIPVPEALCGSAPHNQTASRP